MFKKNQAQLVVTTPCATYKVKKQKIEFICLVQLTILYCKQSTMLMSLTTTTFYFVFYNIRVGSYTSYLNFTKMQIDKYLRCKTKINAIHILKTSVDFLVKRSSSEQLTWICCLNCKQMM